MSEKTNLGLVEWTRQWLGQAYWYGTCCYSCTQNLLYSKTNQYPAYYTDARMPRYRDDIAKGKCCADCVGLIKGYYWENNGKIVYNAATDVNTGGMFNKAKIKEPIATLPNVPGLIVYKSGHVGVYEGSGYVIEAKGFAYGVVRSRITDTPWTHWLVCPFISHPGYEEVLGIGEPVFPCYALVVTQRDPLNIWINTRKSKSLAQVVKGDTLTVTGYADKKDWFATEKNGIHGFSDGQYLLLLRTRPADGAMLMVNEDIMDDIWDADELYTLTPRAYPYDAQVEYVNESLNLRSTPELIEGNTIKFIPRNKTVTVLEDNCGGDMKFSFVQYENVKGYCTSGNLLQLENIAG